MQFVVLVLNVVRKNNATEANLFLDDFYGGMCSLDARLASAGKIYQGILNFLDKMADKDHFVEIE